MQRWQHARLVRELPESSLWLATLSGAWGGSCYTDLECPVSYIESARVPSVAFTLEVTDGMIVPFEQGRNYLDVLGKYVSGRDED